MDKKKPVTGVPLLSSPPVPEGKIQQYGQNKQDDYGQEVGLEVHAEKLPEGFQRSEFLQEHGAIDMIVDRREMRDKISSVLTLLMAGRAKASASAAPTSRTVETEEVVENHSDQA